MPKKSQLAAEEIRKASPDHIRQAVAFLSKGGDKGPFGRSTTYDLVTPDMKRLPPKAVFGYALKLALGRQIDPDEISGADGCLEFKLMRAAGYEIVSKANAGQREQ